MTLQERSYQTIELPKILEIPEESLLYLREK